MGRAKWKGPYIDNKLLNDFNKLDLFSKISINVSSRSSEIVPNFIGKNFKIYNGKHFSNLKITEEMIGHKFGEFSSTRRKFTFKRKKKQ